MNDGMAADADRIQLGAQWPYWAVITGTMRDIFEFSGVLGICLEKRKSGEIAGIVVSTWNDEIDKVPGLRELLRSAGVVIVESDPPGLFVDVSFLQFRSLLNGLSVCPPGAWVLKLRTDKIVTRIAPMAYSMTARERRGAEPIFGASPLFSGRVLIESFSTAEPFFTPDLIFFGRKEDLERMTLFNVTPEIYRPGPFAVEQRWFGSIFANRFSILREYFSSIQARALSSQIIGFVRETKGEAPLPPRIAKLIALYYEILGTHFEISLVSAFHFPFSFNSMFCLEGTNENPHLLQYWSEQTNCRSGEALDFVRNGFAKDKNPLYDSFLRGRDECRNDILRYDDIVSMGGLIDDIRHLSGNSQPSQVFHAPYTQTAGAPVRDIERSDLISLFLHGQSASPEETAHLRAAYGKLLEGRMSAGEVLLEMYKLSGGGSTDVDVERSVIHWLEKAASHKIPEALFRYGYHFMTGQVLNQDGAQARHFLRLAAVTDHIEAKVLYAKLLLNGQGGPIDLDEARRWLTIAARDGHTEARDILNTQLMPQ